MSTPKWIWWTRAVVINFGNARRIILGECTCVSTARTTELRLFDQRIENPTLFAVTLLVKIYLTLNPPFLIAALVLFILFFTTPYMVVIFLTVSLDIEVVS